MTQLHAGIRHRLDQGCKITFGCDGDACVIQDFEIASLLAKFSDTRFQRLIHGQETDFQRLACRDFVDRAT